MAKHHGAKDQRRAAKQKAKRMAKRSALEQRTSVDPTMRLRHADQWPIVEARVGDKLWKEGIGHVLIARRQPEGAIVIAVFLVDVYCLGVKNAFWRAGTAVDLEGTIRHIDTVDKMRTIDPACLAKFLDEAVKYAQSFGFPPHSDYRSASMLLAGIDPSACASEFTFGRDGKPFYVQGPNESPAVVRAIMGRVQEVGGHFLVLASAVDRGDYTVISRESGEFELPDEDDSPDESL